MTSLLALLLVGISAAVTTLRGWGVRHTYRMARRYCNRGDLVVVAALACAGIAVSLSARAPWAPALATALFVSCLLALAWIDARVGLLPDALTLPPLWAGLLTAALDLSALSLDHAIAGAVVGYGMLWTINLFFRLVRGIEGIGHGDFKLLGAIGAWLGAYQLGTVILVGTIVTLIAQAIAHFLGHHRRRFPFGPGLVIGCLSSLAQSFFTHA